MRIESPPRPRPCFCSLELAFGWHVGAVGTFLQCSAIDDGYVAATRRDETRIFQCLHCDRHARTMGAEHEAEELVSERELFAVDAVVRHEQPARQSLFDLAAAV